MDFDHNKLYAPLPINMQGTIALAKSSGWSPPQSVPLRAGGKFNGCYWNVDRVIKSHGGKPIYGWKLQTARNYFAEAIHHAVWMDLNEELWDVTALGKNHQSTNSITFCADDSWTWEDRFPPCVPNKIIGIHSKNSDDLQALARAHDDYISHKKKFIEEAKRKGYIYDENSGIEIEAGDSLMAMLEEIHRLSEIEWEVRLRTMGIRRSV